MSFYSQYPAVSGGGLNPSVGPNGVTAPTNSTEVGGINPSGNLQPLQTDAAGNLLVNLNAEAGAPLHVIVDSSALPTGASTSALQTTGNTSLADIDSKTPALGQALAAASSPVVLTAAQIATLTPLSTVTVVQPTGTNLHTVVDNFPATQPVSGTVAVSSLPSIPTGANAIGSVSVSNFPATQPVSGTVTANIGTTNGLALNATVALQNLAQGSTTSGQVGPLVQAAVMTNAPTYVAGQTSPLTLTLTGDLRVSETLSSTSVVTSVAASATSVVLLSSNVGRKNAVFYNNSTSILYLKLGVTAATTSYTVQLVGGAYFELPIGKIYDGEIDGIWDTATGSCLVTELT